MLEATKQNRIFNKIVQKFRKKFRKLMKTNFGKYFTFV